MLLQRILSGARVGRAGIHPDRNVMVTCKRGNRFVYATRGDDVSTPMEILYATIFLAGSLIGPGYYFLQFRKLKLKRDEQQ